MEYTKITCTLSPDNELARELLMQALGDAGCESFVENEADLEAYIPSSLYSRELLLTDEFQNNPLFSFQYVAEVIADQNWNEVWEKNYFEPLLIEDQCLVRAPFHENYPAAAFEIIINPRMAFGTGNHETTHLMIKAMLEMELKELDVLDMGCGSGILSILASMKGAKHITAIDIDEWSTNNTLENAALNHVVNILVRLGDAALLYESQYDVILANIQRNILLEDMPAYVKVLKPGGVLLMSGFYTTDLPMISQKATELGLKITGSYDRSAWCAVSFSC
jgi:ribosomal protein L11 methyltransferase